MTAAQRSKHDIAYVCFIPPGLVSLVAALARAIPMSSGTAGGIGFLVLIPLSLLALISIPIGIYLSIVLRRDVMLPLLSVLTILMLAEVVTEAGTVAFYNASSKIYGLLNLFCQATWFLFRRRRPVTTEDKKPA